MSAAVEGAGQDLVPSYPAGEVLDLPDVMRQRLKDCEARMAHAETAGWEAAIEYGKALIEVHDAALWRAFTEEEGAPRSFDDYLRVRHAMDRNRAYRLMDLARLDAALSPIGNALPIPSEWVARQLAPVLKRGGEEMVQEEWKKISEEFRDQRSPTGNEVRRRLIKSGALPKPGQSVGGRMTAFVALGTVGERVAALEKRSEGFFQNDLKKRKVGSDTRAKAIEIADRLAVWEKRFREFGETS